MSNTWREAGRNEAGDESGTPEDGDLDRICQRRWGRGPGRKVIHMQRKQPEAGTSSKPAIEQPSKSLETELDDSTAKEDDCGAKKSSLRLFGVHCERCIRDDFTCIVVLGKKKGEVRKFCQHCEVKKNKCVRPSPEREEELCAAFIQKKHKAAAAAEKKTRVMQKGLARAPPQSRTNVRSGTRSVSRKRLPSAPAEASDEDAEGEGDTEIDAVADARPEQGRGSTSGDGEIEIEKQEAGKIPEHDAIVDNDDKMHFDVAAAVALGKKFDALPQTSGDRAEALHKQTKSRVNALDQRWEGRFATIEAKVCDVPMRSSVNAVSLGHMGNAIHAFNRTGKLPAFDPPAGQSLGHPYGQLHSSCLPHVGKQDFCEVELAPHSVVDGWLEQAMEGPLGVGKAELWCTVWCNRKRTWIPVGTSMGVLSLCDRRFDLLLKSCLAQVSAAANFHIKISQALCVKLHAFDAVVINNVTRGSSKSIWA
ncbi:hypothetical protein BDR07DRAFT_1381316 [Suillus spraguei]|nr:hypothetical protein BDR07DRAFT_1381316 [Suillus spraguei]